MSHEERRWVAAAALALLVITSLPYLLGYQRAGADWQFSGFVLGVDDGNSYIAKMLRGAEGDWLFRSPYSAEKQDGFLAFLPYLLLGKLTSQPGQHEQLVSLYHLYRWAGGFALAFAVYAFVSLFLEQRKQRQMAALLALAGGGLGWLAMLGLGGLWGERVPLEFYSPESFGFLSLLSLPHLEFGRALLLAGLAATLRPAPGWLGWVLPGLLWLALGFFQPLTIASGWAVLGMFLLVRGVVCLVRKGDPACTASWKNDLLRAVVTGVISLPWVAYNFAAFQIDPYLRGWSRQNIILSPPPADYLLAYGVMLALGVLGLRSLWRRDERAAALLAGWLAAFPLLAYFPYPLQRRLPEGFWVALAVLGTAGFVQLSKRWKKITAPLVALAFLPAVFLVLGALLSAWTPQEPVFIPAHEVRAYQFLRAESGKDEVVLASFAVSNRVPAWAPVRTITGHGPESTGAKEIEPRIDRFFQAGVSNEERLSLIHDYGIRFVMVKTKTISDSGWYSEIASDFEPVYVDESGEVIIYELDEEGQP